MKYILLPVAALFALANTVAGQSITVANLTLTHQPDSKIVYAAIDNYFKLTAAATIENVESGEAMVHVSADILKVVPRKAGAVNIRIKTAGGVQVVTFDSYILPELSVAISSDGNATVGKEEMIRFGKILLLGGKKDVGGFASHYRVKRWQAQLNDQLFFIEGEQFSDAFKTAVRDCKSGSSIKIGNIEAYNPDNKKQLTIPGKNLYACTIQ